MKNMYTCKYMYLYLFSKYDSTTWAENIRMGNKKALCKNFLETEA